MGIQMTEAVQEKVDTGHGARMTAMDFDPQILAFCCEH
jgi:hypothetical protein